MRAREAGLLALVTTTGAVIVGSLVAAAAHRGWGVLAGLVVIVVAWAATFGRID